MELHQFVRILSVLEKTVKQQEERIKELEKLHDVAYTNGYQLGFKHGVSTNNDSLVRL